MGTSSVLFKKALAEYDQLKEKKQREMNFRKEKVYASIPRIKEIDEQLSKIGMSLPRFVLDNENVDVEKIIASAQQRCNALKAEKERLLVTNGFSSDYLVYKYDCEICGDSGYIVNKRCKCLEAMLLKYSYEDSNMAALLKTQGFELFKFSYYSPEIDPYEGMSPLENMKSIYRTCREFVENFDFSNDNILMCGNSGLGKTFLSTSIAKELMSRGKYVYYQTAYRLFKIMEDDRFNRIDNENDKYIASKIYSVDLLIIDDLGTEFMTAYTHTALFDLLNSRLLDNKKTIINTNNFMEKLSRLYNERIVSRLVAGYIYLRFIGEDIRKLSAIRKNN